MNTLPAFVHLPVLTRTQCQLLFFAAMVAAALLSFYVQLLHSSLARGDELREVQRVAGAKKAKAMTPGAPPGLVRARTGLDRPDARPR